MKLCEYGHIRWGAKYFLVGGDPSQSFNGSQIVYQNNIKQDKQPQEIWSSSAIKQLNGATFKILNVTLAEVLILFLWLWSSSFDAVFPLYFLYFLTCLCIVIVTN